MRRAAVLLAAAVALAACAGPAGATNGWWTFDRDTNTNSTLTWKWTYPPSPAQYVRSWRAGSGSSTDECQRGKGGCPRAGIRSGATGTTTTGAR